jgi:hypothetical protein
MHYTLRTRRVSEHLEGGVATWREVSQDCHTSEDFLTALLTHLTAVSVTHADEFLTAKVRTWFSCLLCFMSNTVRPPSSLRY